MLAAAIATGMASAQVQVPASDARYELQSEVRFMQEAADSTAYFYDDYHRPTRADYWNQSGINPWEFRYSTGTDYNAQGYPICQYDPNSKNEYKYDAQGRLIERLLYQWSYVTNELQLSSRWTYTYNSDGQQVETRTYLMPYSPEGGTELKLTTLLTYKYNERGLVSERTYTSYNRNAPGEVIASASMYFMSYDPELDLQVKTVQKQLDIASLEWTDYSETTVEYEMLPFPVDPVQRSPYYKSKETTVYADGTSKVSTYKYTMEGDYVFYKTESTNSVGDYKYLYVASDGNTGSLRTISSKIINVTPGVQEQQTDVSYEYNDRGNVIRYCYIMAINYINNPTQSFYGGTLTETEYDDQDRVIKKTSYSKDSHISDDFQLVELNEYEYVGATPQADRYIVKRFSNGEQFATTDLTLTFNMDVPAEDLNFYGMSSTLKLPLYYMPLTATDEANGDRYLYHYTDTTTGGVSLPTGSNDSYSVWPTKVIDTMHITVPDGILPQVEVYSMAGIRVATTCSDEISLANLPAGLYIANVNGHTFRIVKK